MGLTPWNQIRDEFNDTLILGNGASIAIWDKLKYNSLFDASQNERFLDDEALDIFLHFNTKDFEFILQSLSRAAAINKFLNIVESKTEDKYKQVKDALIHTIKSVHPEQKDISEEINNIIPFLIKFKLIFSLNYDLIVYWAMLCANKDAGGNLFKDLFKNGIFAYDEEWMRTPQTKSGIDKTILVFYPHGNLIFTTNEFGEEAKVHKDKASTILGKIGDLWGLQQKRNPLFVSEGDSKSKLSAIRRNGYLNRVYNYELPAIERSIVVYGWSMSEQDDHILQAISKSKVEKIAVSVYADSSGDITGNINYLKQKILKKIKIKEENLWFFDSSDDEVWNNRNQ